MNKNYPQNLIEDICTGDLSKEEVKKNYVYDEDHIKGLEYALSLLPEKMQDIFKKRYIECKTLREIGEHYGTSGAYLSSVVQKYLRVLRHPKRFKYIKNGYEGEFAIQREKEKVMRNNEGETPILTEELYGNAEKVAKLYIDVLFDKYDGVASRRIEIEIKCKKLTLGVLDTLSDDELKSKYGLTCTAISELREAFTYFKKYFNITENLADGKSKRNRIFDKCYGNAEEFGKLPVTVLYDKLSTRTINALMLKGWMDKGKEITLAELDSMSKEEMLQIRNLGEKSAKELRDVITELKEHLGIIKTPKVIYKIRSREDECGECGYEVTVPEGTDEAEVYKNFEMASKYAWVSGADNPEDYDEHFEEMLEVKESCNGEEAFNYYLEKICGYKIESIQYDYDYEW